VRKGRHQHRVVKIGEDGLSEDQSYCVKATDFIPDTDEETSSPNSAQQISQVGQRGMIFLSASLRARFGIREGGFVLQEPTEKGILVRPADVVPREIGDQLSGLLAKVTPKNIHAEIGTGDPVGSEAW
jgi:hypothetical protein